MIDIKNITMTYRGGLTPIKSLDDVSIKINTGSIFGLIGSNGSGKSTLLRIMAGIIKPDSGSVEYDGSQVFENEAAKQRVVCLSDEQYFLPGASINDMKEFYKTVRTDFSEENFRKLRDIFKLDCDRKIQTFSKGMKKQASVMLGIASRPDYLLCDETFDGLDPVVRQLVKRIIAEESADGKMTTVIASHNLREMEDICDTVALLHKGGLLFESGLDDMKLGLHKIQAVFADGITADELTSLNVLSLERRGSLVTIIARGDRARIEDFLRAKSPTFFELIPLTLEEIFICEMEEKGYDFSKLIY